MGRCGRRREPEGVRAERVREGNGSVSLFSVHHDAEYLLPGWIPLDGYDPGGTAPGMHVWFDIPAGETRWVNVDAYAKLRCSYNGTSNGASAQAGLSATLRFIVLDPQ
jgi:hypothetical protein